MSSTRQDFEVIISDNNDESDEILNSYVHDSRIRIVRPTSVLSMSSNYEFAITHTSGEWVQLMGSDDAILPWYFDQLDVLIDLYKNIRVITWRRAYYFWPGSPSVYNGRCLEFSGNLQRKVCRVKRPFLFSLLGLKSIFELPQLYTGSLIKKNLIDEIRFNSMGLFYHSIIPDIYSTVAIMNKVDQYLYCNLPLTLIGTSGRTMGMPGRIYNDSANLNYYNLNSPRKIHPSINENLHSSGYGSIYLLECYRSAPFINTAHQSDFYTIAAYLDVLNSIKIGKVTKNFTHLIIQQIREDYLLRNSYAYLVIILLPFLKLICFFYFRFYIPIVFKLNGGLRQRQKLLKFESINRNEFTDIESAALKIFYKLKEYL